jgi:transposase
MAYNTQYRTRVVEYILEGHTQEEASGIFKVGTTSIKRWLAATKLQERPAEVTLVR